MNDAALVAQQADVLEAVRRALWRYEPVRSRDLPISLDLNDAGALVVSGHVPTGVIKRDLLAIAGSVAGVNSVEDGLVADPDLELAIAESLATDARTRQLDPGAVQVFAQLGVISLVGEIDAALRAAAVQVASEVPGVRAVSDRLGAA